MRFFLSFAVVALAALVGSCSRQQDQSAGNPSGPDAVLAVVGGERITVGDFESELNQRTRNSGMRYSTEEQKRALLDEMIEFRVLLQKAKAAGYDRDPELLARFRRMVVSKFREDHLGTNVDVSLAGEQAVSAFYQQNQERFVTPESVHLAVIYFRSSPKATSERRADTRAKAEAVLAQARQTDAAGFGKLAQQYSEDQGSRYSGGDIGWLVRGDTGAIWGKTFEDAAFGISDPGNFAPLLEAPQGFYIIRLLEKKQTGVRPFDDVKDAIAYQLARERQQKLQIDFLEEMKKGIRIESNPSLLRTISAPERVSDQTPPPLPKD